MEGTTAPAPTVGSTPLADDEDDAGLFIEAPVLPEPPEAVEDDIAFLLASEAALPPAKPAAEDLVASGMTGFDRAFEVESSKASPNAVPPLTADAKARAPFTPSKVAPVPVAETQAEPAQIPHEAGSAAEAERERALTSPEPVHAPGAESVPSASAAQQVPPPLKRVPRVDPLAALASLKMETKRPVAKPKAVDHRVSINSLMGELTSAGRSGLPAVLRMDVPPDLDGHEIEVVVQLRSQGQVVAEGTIHHSLPGKGSTSRLSVEFKRS
jgi:hypothetical protein